MIFAIFGGGSLVCSAWALGLIKENERGRSLTVDISLPCLGSGRAEVLLTSTLSSTRSNVVNRAAAVFSTVEESASISQKSDTVTIELRVSDQEGHHITYDFLKTCRFDIELWANVPISRFWDGFARPLTTHRPLVPVVPGFNYAIRGQDLLVLGNDIAFISFEPARGFMQRRGASRGTFEQVVGVSGEFGKSPRLTVASEIDIPIRFDEVRTYGSVAPAMSAGDGEYQRIRSSLDFVQHNEMVHTGTLDPPAPHGVFEGAEMSDSGMKRLEDFILFIAAATFGVAVGPALELAIGKRQGKRSRLRRRPDVPAAAQEKD